MTITMNNKYTYTRHKRKQLTSTSGAPLIPHRRTDIVAKAPRASQVSLGHHLLCNLSCSFPQRGCRAQVRSKQDAASPS